jgi:hypothetical protein
MTRHKSLALATAVSVAATSGCAAIQHRFAFMHFPHFGQHAPSWQVKPVIPAESQTASDDGYYDEAAKAISRKDYATALDMLEQARAHKANDVRVLNAFGVVYDKLGRFDLSTRYYAQASELDPGSAIIANNMAYSLIMQQQSTLQAKPAMTTLAVDPAPVYRASASFRAAGADPDVNLKLGDPIVAQTTSRAPSADPLVLTPATQPLLQRASLTGASGPLTPPRLDALFIKMAMTPAASPVSVARAPQSQPAAAKGRIVAVAPGVMRLELGAQPAPMVLLAKAGATPTGRTLAVGPMLAGRPLAGGPMLTGHPLTIVDASGRVDGAVHLRETLAGRGWTLKVAGAAPLEAHTVIFYDRDNLPVAQGLARSLPFPVKLAACDNACSGVRLIVGADSAGAKPVAAPHHAVERKRSADA